MQKNDDDIKLFSTDSSLKTNVSLDEIKTTNINILLNRVKIEKKDAIKKNFLITAGALGTLAITGIITIL